MAPNSANTGRTGITSYIVMKLAKDKKLYFFLFTLLEKKCTI